MAKKSSKNADTVRTEVMTKEVRIPIDAEEIEAKERQGTKIQLKIRKIQKEIQPQLHEITELRSKHRKLMEDIESGTELTKAKVYEVKDFKRAKATIYLAENDQKVDERTLEKSEYNVDLTEAEVEDEEAN